MTETTQSFAEELSKTANVKLYAAGILSIQLIAAGIWGISTYIALGIVTEDFRLTAWMSTPCFILILISSLVVSRWLRVATYNSEVSTATMRTKTVYLLSLLLLASAIIPVFAGLALNTLGIEFKGMSVTLIASSIIPALLAGLLFEKHTTRPENKWFYFDEAYKAIMTAGGLLKVK